MSGPIDANPSPPAESPPSPPKTSFARSESSKSTITGFKTLNFDSEWRYNDYPNEASREAMRQSWRQFEAEAAKPDVIQRHEILKVTQSFSFDKVQAKVETKLIELGFLPEQAHLAISAIVRTNHPNSFTEADVLEEALEILETNIWA